MHEHLRCCLPLSHVCSQVMAVLDAMPSGNLKPDTEDATLDSNRVYRTTYMFSATMPSAVERLARKYLRRPVVINIGSAGKATDNVTQRVFILKVEAPPRRDTAVETACCNAGVYQLASPEAATWRAVRVHCTDDSDLGTGDSAGVITLARKHQACIAWLKDATPQRVLGDEACAVLHHQEVLQACCVRMR